jgi:hypothetical protein
MRRHTVADILTLTIFLVVISHIPAAYAEALSGSPTVLKSASELDYPPFAIVQPDGIHTSLQYACPRQQLWQT